MPGTEYRFGRFVVDRARYRVRRDDQPLELSPKLLDLLLHLVDHAGELVTKDQLLDALWAGANVTDNALAQAVSELREALGDDAGAPQFIKTVARRGYRFIAPVERTDAAPERAAATTSPAAPADSPERSIAVMDFLNVTGDPQSAWLSAGIAETVTGDLRAIGGFRVIDRRRVMDAVRVAGESVHEVSAHLGTTFAAVGSFQTSADRIRISARIIDVGSGEAIADAKVDGPIAGIFELQDQIVTQFAGELGLRPAVSRAAPARETPSLEAYRAYTEAWLHLETLDMREIPQAIADFERAIAIDPGYALAFTGLASAQLAAYDATRSDTTPASHRLQDAIAHARRAVALDDALAEAHATLGFVLVRAWQTAEAVQVARRAVALEPTNWRHFFRLGHAAWGDERLRAAKNTLSLYPDFAFAHFQMAMVHVARGQLRDAETVLRHGAAVQDRQVARGDRYPALGLHWLLALVRLAQGDTDEALDELAREEQRADPHRLYGREYAMSAVHARGACLLHLGRHQEASACFERALALYPEHAQSHIGLVVACRALGSTERADAIARALDGIVMRLSASRPIEAALVDAERHAVLGSPEESGAILCRMLDSAPPGYAGWTIPVEPLLTQVRDTDGFRVAMRLLADRAR